MTESSNEKSAQAGSSSDHVVPDDGDMAEKFAPDEIVFAFVADCLRKEIAKEQAKPRGAKESLRALAERYDTVHPHLIAIRDNKTGVGHSLAKAYARQHYGDSYDALREAAKRWSDENPERARRPPPPQWMQEGLRYPRMSPALLMAFGDGVDEGFLRSFARKTYGGAEVLTGEEWWHKLKAALADELLQKSAKAQRTAKKLREGRVAPKTLDDRK